MPLIRNLLRTIEPRAARLLEALGRLAYPPHCVVCRRPNREDEDRYLCRRCINAIDFVSDPTCPRCGHELGPHVDPGERCIGCRNVPLRFARSIAAARHAGAARQMVLALKFGGQRHNAFPLSKLIAARLGGTDIAAAAQVIVPVPLHRRRLRSRGFNQAELIAEKLSDQIGLPMLAGNLVRTINTPPQTMGMSLAGRRANVKGAFAVKRPKAFDGKTVLLIDDVMTTGSTASECAGVLRRAGAKRVFVATVTRAMTTPAVTAEHAARPVRYRIESALPPGMPVES